MFCKKLPRLAGARPFCAQNGFKMRLPCARRVPPRGKALCAPRGSAPVPPHRTPASARAPAAHAAPGARQRSKALSRPRKHNVHAARRVFPAQVLPVLRRQFLCDRPAAEIFYKRRRIARIFRKCRRATALCGKRQDVFPEALCSVMPECVSFTAFLPR